jgi:hypothetical protein
MWYHKHFFGLIFTKWLLPYSYVPIALYHISIRATIITMADAKLHHDFSSVHIAPTFIVEYFSSNRKAYSNPSQSSYPWLAFSKTNQLIGRSLTNHQRSFPPCNWSNLQVTNRGISFHYLMQVCNKPLCCHWLDFTYTWSVQSSLFLRYGLSSHLSSQLHIHIKLKWHAYLWYFQFLIFSSSF